MDLKKILYNMLVKYYLSDNIKAPFEEFALGLENAQAGPVSRMRRAFKQQQKQDMQILAQWQMP